MTYRAVETLRQVDRVAAEDTRHSQRLLSHFGLAKKMLSLHEHNERERIEPMLNLLKQGQRIALISDAGTPLISDPGFPLVRAVIGAGVRVTPVPGASSIITALCAAGLPTDHFCFHGFLSHKNKLRKHQLQAISRQQGTHVCLESTHRIENLIEQIGAQIPDAELVLAKELTKRYESFIRGTALECQQRFNQDRALLKGEFVVLIRIDDSTDGDVLQLDSSHLLQRLMQDLSLNKAVRMAADISGKKRNDLYQLALSIMKK